MEQECNSVVGMKINEKKMKMVNRMSSHIRTCLYYVVSKFMN